MISILFNGLISLHARVNVLYIIELISFFKIDFFVKLKNEIIVESLFDLFNFILLSIISIEIIR